MAKLYSFWDKDTQGYLNSGLNSKTKKALINDGIDFILSDGGTGARDERLIRSMSLKAKQAHLAIHNLIIEEHKEIIEQ
jgi:hypothetical protein